MSRGRRGPGSGRIVGWAAIAAIVTMLVAPAFAAATPVERSPGVPTPDPGGPLVYAVSVTWNGHNISAASSVGSALRVTTGGTINVGFSFQDTNPARSLTARLQAFYFGAALSTNEVPATVNGITGAGTASMNWSLGSYTYLLEGAYRLTASLVANGSTVFSEDFYIDEQAPYAIGSGFVLFLIVLGIFELISLATIGRSSRRRRRPRSPAPAPAPWGGPAPPPGGSPEPSEPEVPPEGAPPPPLPQPPSSGGEP